MTAPGSQPLLAIDHAILSDVGMRREANQDSLATTVTDDQDIWCQRGHLLVVADGMGAHAAGELASKLATDHIPHNYYKSKQLSAPAALRQAIRDANQVIHTKGQTSIDFQGMGTTCTCVALLPQGALVAHVGDSRAYRLRGTQLEQLSFDHSLVWEMAAASHTTEEQVPAFIPKNVITRSLGPHPTVNIDLEGPFPIEPGDTFLLCSDGLSGQVSDEEMGTLLLCLSSEDAAQTLIDLANLRGGPDNISVIVARVAGQDAEQQNNSQLPRPAGNHAPTLASRSNGIVLLTMLASLALVAWSGMTRSTPGLILGAAGLGAAAAFACVVRLLPRPPAAAPVMGGPYGNGPYRQCVAEPSREIVETLSELAQQLEKLSEKEEWQINWELVKQHRSAADAAMQANDSRQAVVELCLLIRTAMRLIREHRATVSTDSGIDLN